jgi:hypothetical protein
MIEWQLENRIFVVPFPLSERNFSLPRTGQTCPGAHTALYAWVWGNSFLGGKAARLVKLNTHFCLVQRIRISGAILPVLHTHLFCTGTRLSLFSSSLVFSLWAGFGRNQSHTSQATGMALARCILGKILAVVFPLSLHYG